MEGKLKVSIIIICQIALIIGSFLTLSFYESQTTLIGNSINVAGKNRFLASQFIDEVKDQVYLKNPEANPEAKLIDLQENIYLLKNGGVLNQNLIPKLELKFEKDWLIIQENFATLKTEYLEFRQKDNFDLTYLDIVPLDLESNLFIESSNNLVENIGNELKILSERLIFLQIIFSIINVTVHIGLIFLIIKIFQNEFKKRQKLEKLAIIGELASKLSHDMRTPLSNLSMGLKLMDQGIMDKTEREKIKIMERATTRLSNQISNVLDFVRSREPIINVWQLNLILKETLTQINLPKTIKITLPEQDLAIKCDKEQFEILFLNLIKNSIDTISEEGFIKISASETPSKIIIKIEDSGPGIPDEYIDQVFEPLITLKNKGTGLGLASCKSIVKSHGGTISAKNNPTTFTIILPKLNHK